MNSNYGLVTIIPLGIFAIFGILCISGTEGLTCYQCRYHEGEPFTQKDCEDDPNEGYLRSVPDPYGDNRNKQFPDRNFGYNHSLAVFSTGGNEPSYGRNFGGVKNNYASMFPYCMKIKGEKNGKDIVIRDMAWSNKDTDNDVCQSRLPDSWNEPGIKDVKACYCNDKTGCNGASLFSLALTPFLIGIISYFMK